MSLPPDLSSGLRKWWGTTLVGAIDNEDGQVRDGREYDIFVRFEQSRAGSLNTLRTGSCAGQRVSRRLFWLARNVHGKQGRPSDDGVPAVTNSDNMDL